MQGKNGSKTKLALKVNAMQKLKSQEMAACCFFSHQGSSLSLHEIKFMFNFTNMSVVQICSDQNTNYLNDLINLSVN